MVTMKMSFRITNQIREFVNNVMLGEPRMNACRDGMNVFYVRRDPRNMLNIIHYQIKRLLQEGAFVRAAVYNNRKLDLSHANLSVEKFEKFEKFKFE